MNKIIINRGSFKLDEVVFEQGTTTIGRANNNTIALDDNAVSSHHAKIVTLFNTSYIEDLDSTNGTMVNGKSVQKRTLHSGDIISLGNHQLLFQSDEARSRTDDVSDTVMLNGSEIKQKLTEFLQAQVEQNNPASAVQELRNSETIKTSRSHETNSRTPLSSELRHSRASHNSADSLNKEKNRAWLEAKNTTTAAKTPAPLKQNIADAGAESDVAHSAITDKSRQRSPEAIRNTATAIRSVTRNAPLPAAPSGESASTQKIPVDIAAAARSALQSRRATDSDDGDSPATAKKATPKNSAKPFLPRNKGARNDPGSNFTAKNGAVALGGGRSNNKILPMIWLIIVAVLIAEVVYITYRSFG